MSKRRFLYIALCALPLILLSAVFLLPRDESTPVEPRTAPGPTQLTVLPSPQPTAQSTAQPEKYAGPFELPLEGATGFATINLNLRSSPDAASETMGSVQAGSGFRILGQDGDFWRISDGKSTGYVAHRYCMVNLPDVIPSIVYDNTNAYSSRLLSSGKVIPGVTGEALYENTAYNPRLGRDEFIMPVLYSMALKIQAAQNAALADGNSLKIYEAYRPYQVQRRVVDAMALLAAQDDAVRAGVSSPPWKVSWFISQGISQHQRGCAIDVSLVKVNRSATYVSGPYAYENVEGYTEYEMPTAIHELSSAAAAFSEPVSSYSATAWHSAAPASSMNRAAHLLQQYCAGAGLTPLASEWWHFNDLDAYGQIKDNACSGDFVLTRVYSVEPPDPA